MERFIIVHQSDGLPDSLFLSRILVFQQGTLSTPLLSAKTWSVAIQIQATLGL